MIGDFYAYGTWPDYLIKAWDDYFISISPLGYTVITGAVKVTIQIVKPPELETRQHGSWLIARSNNDISCYACRRHLSTKLVMSVCVELQTETE